MSKAPNKKVEDLTRFSKSTFTLTFVVEVLGLDVWHDCNEGWLDLGPCHQAMRLQYQLYPDHSFDLDILIWPHIAKIWCEGHYGYVRTWQFLERRWFAFSIRHAFPVRVLELMNHVVTVNCSMGFGSISNNAKNDKNIEAFLPPIKFSERRYFGEVLEAEDTIAKVIQNMLWHIIKENVPASYLDGTFNTPEIVTDIRHQDAVLFNVKQKVLDNTIPVTEDLADNSKEAITPKDKRGSKVIKEKEKKKIVEVQKEKFVISLSGDTILAGVGKVIPFETMGELIQDQNEVVVLISTSNLPAQDDQPIIFINVENLINIPVEELKKARISQLYTKWKLNEEEHESKKQYIKSRNSVNFNDHHTVPLPYPLTFEATALFLDNNFEIEIHGLRNVAVNYAQKLYGTDKYDKNNCDNADIVIAVTRIDASVFATNNNRVIKGEFSLYPPKVSIEKLDREAVSTNDINCIRLPVVPDRDFNPSVILDAHMTLDASIGFVGCKPQNYFPSYSRLYCCAHNPKAIKVLTDKVKEINMNIVNSGDKNNSLTGFVIDTCDLSILYIEGPTDGFIIKVWELTADFYPNLKLAYSCSDKYRGRIYSEFLSSDMPFNILKMVVPITTLLKCPQVYVKPTLPLPAKKALLKLGRLIGNNTKVRIVPFTNEMPSFEELESLKLELCIPLTSN